MFFLLPIVMWFNLLSLATQAEVFKSLCSSVYQCVSAVSSLGLRSCNIFSSVVLKKKNYNNITHKLLETL